MYEEEGIENIIFYTNLNPHRPEGVPTNPKKFESAINGIVGYDFYRSPFLSFSGYSSMARILRYLDSILKFTWSAEFMAGWWFEDISKCWLTAEHHKFMSLCAISNGCKGIFYFMFHDRETWGGSPVSDKGHIRSTYYGIKDFLEITKKFENWNNLKVYYDEIGVVYYRPYHWHTYLGDPSPCNDNVVHVGEPEIKGLKSGILTKEYEEIFRLLLLAGYNPRIIEIIDKPEEIKKCKVLFFSLGPFLDKKTEKLLLNFVKNGGILISGPFIPEFTPEQETIRSFKNIIHTNYISKVEKFENEKICLNEFLFNVEGKKIIEINGISVLSKISYGKGIIYFLGGFIGQNEPLTEPEQNINLLRKILKDEKINPFVEIIVQPVENTISTEKGFEKFYEKKNLVLYSVLTDGENFYLFLNNLYNRSIEFEIKLRDKFDKGTNLETNEKIRIENKVINLTIDCKSTIILKLS